MFLTMWLCDKWLLVQGVNLSLFYDSWVRLPEAMDGWMDGWVHI